MVRSLFVIASLMLISCDYYHTRVDDNTKLAHGTYNEALEYDIELELEPPRTAEPPPAHPTFFGKNKMSKLIKRGNMSIDVVKLPDSKRRIDSILIRNQSYYEREEYMSNEISNSYSLTIRVPVTYFDSLINQLENGIGKLKYKSIFVDDVTEEYHDLDMRLKNKLAFLNQYRMILQKAVKIKEIIEVQEKIRRIEEEIESKKGRLRFLDDQISYSTLRIELSEIIKYDEQPKSGLIHKVKLAFNEGVMSFLSFLLTLISLWPVLLFLLLLYFLRRKIIDRIKGIL